MHRWQSTSHSCACPPAMLQRLITGIFHARRCAAPLSLLVGLAGALHGCAAHPTTVEAAPPRSEPRLFEGMGDHHRTVTTTSPEAQRYVDQGLVWMYAFNHDEAIRSFAHATTLDPDCAMAWWGIAICHGPHINNPMMDEARSRAAWAALQNARAVCDGGQATDVERALVEAVSGRYADPAAGPLPLSVAERGPLDRAYAEAMAAVWAAHPTDPDVGTLYAESLMDLRPWDLWGAEGAPRPETPLVLETLDRVLVLQPMHPGANHLAIHAHEASPEPWRAKPSADRLRTLVPASSHLIHMPGHIDVRLGDWALAAEQNRQAAAVDRAYERLSPRQDFYRLYMSHNEHFLAWTCMMLGRREEALAAARSMIAEIPESWLRANAPYVDPTFAIESEVLMRFGRWDEILALPEPASDLPITIAKWRFARASAFAAKGQIDEAVAEQRRFRSAVDAVPEEAMMQVNPARRVLAIAEHTLEGEIAFRRGDIDGAVRALSAGVEIEDTLVYMEPPEWIQPVRHALGAVLTHANRTHEAKAVYEADLERWPENGWSLFGLWSAQRALNDPAAAKTHARFERAWADADTRIGATCLCVKAAE